MAIFVSSGRVALAKIIKTSPLHLAWGSGIPAWDATPVDPSITDTDLVSEIGRRAATTVEYCTPDVNGSIEVTDGRFTYSATPTTYIHVSFNFAAGDAPSSTVREVGIFIGSTFIAEPGGQYYFPIGEVVSKGLMLISNRFAALNRSPSIRQYFEFVISL